MTKIERFEYPLPVLKTSAEKITIETSGACRGNFTISNGGGGLLSGVITSNSRAVRFRPEEFTGNDSRIEYSLALETFKNGDIINTDAVIQTNGGEKVIPVCIKIVPQEIHLEDGGRITGLNDFLAFAKRNTAAARDLFVSAEFMMWLTATGCAYMDLYDRLSRDSDKDRGLENFLILSKLKTKVRITTDEPEAEFLIEPLAAGAGASGGGGTSAGLREGFFTLKKSDWGFVDEPVQVRYKSKWLTLEKERVRSEDFDENALARLRFLVDSSKIHSPVVSDVISAGDAALRVTVKRRPYMSVYLSKEYMGLDDEGGVRILNYTGKDIMVEIETRDNFIKFEGRRYLVSKYAEIPFKVKMTTLQLAQLTFKRQPAVVTEITARLACDGGMQVKRLPLVIGEF
ncbi:MAG: DUF5717 family protein [Clostridiales bacterium]|jgi:hypothetical protein|nr:DUF5717 family protein [Clostridiales bacterium]